MGEAGDEREKERKKDNRERERGREGALALFMGFYEAVFYILRPLYHADKGIH